VTGLTVHLAMASTGIAVLATKAREPAAAGPGVVALSDSPTPPVRCQVAFVRRDLWNTGFTADIVVTNRGPRIDGWVLRYTSGGVRVVHGWNGVWTQQGDQVSVRNADWNAALEPGTSVKTGLRGAYDRVNPPPTGFSLNGVACDFPVVRRS